MRRHLQVLGAPVVLSLEVERSGARIPITGLLAHARSASDAVGAHMRGRLALTGVTASCGPKCSACCSQLVPVAPVEALGIAHAVDALPEPERANVQRRFADVVKRLERASLLDAKAPKGRTAMQVQGRPGETTWDALNRRYRELRLPCPLLAQDASCAIYASRPAACREYAVSSPKEHCGDPRKAVTVLPRPVRLGEALASAGVALTGEPTRFLPLALALEWASEAAPRWEARTFDDAEAARVFLDAVEVTDT